jgi:hypothetical protein
MAEALTDHLTLRDDGDEPQCPLLAQRTGAHLQMQPASQQPGPRPLRGARLRGRASHPLLARGGDDAPAERAVRRQTPPIAYQMDGWQGDQRCELLSEFHR